MVEEEQTLDLTTINDNGESNVEGNVEENNGEEERGAAEAAAKAEEERVAAEAAAKAEEERVAAEGGTVRNKQYMVELMHGKRKMTDEDKKYIEDKLDVNKKNLFKRTTPASKEKFLRDSINEKMY